MSHFYLWIKVVHILAVISWMAGMLYLPRLFVYHADAAGGSTEAKTFAVMERRLMRAIMLPALLAVWASGITLAIWGGFLHEGWFQAKFALVIAMSALHGYFAIGPQGIGGRNESAWRAVFSCPQRSSDRLDGGDRHSRRGQTNLIINRLRQNHLACQNI